MKRLCALLALCLMLSGCQSKETIMVTPTTEPAPATLPTQAEPTQPPETEAPLLPMPEPAEDAMVPVSFYLPQALQEMKYATEDNFTGQVIYEFQDVYLRYGTVKKLMAVEAELREQGLGLKLWDGFRPVAAQFKLWEVCPDPTFVADPRKGYSNHSRGYAIDLTLVDAAGKEPKMPTAFDDFSAKADRDYTDCTEEEAKNAILLQEVMERHGFKGYYGEWWHFNDTDTYPVEETFQPVSRQDCCSTALEPLLLFCQPDPGSEILYRIPTEEPLQLLGYQGSFAMVQYRQLWGFVLTDCITMG